MTENKLDALMAASQRRLVELEKQAADMGAPPDFSIAALQELASSLEELHVAAEELRAQNDELAAARQNLEVERQRYLDLFELAPDPYLVTTPETAIREANRAAGALFGVAPEFLVGKPLSIFLPERERSAFRSAVNALNRDPTVTAKAWDLEIEPRQGCSVPVAVTVTALWEGGRVIGLRWLLRDITERRQHDDLIRKFNQDLQSRVLELAIANRELESFGYSVSHELRAPLRHIEGFTKVLREEYGSALDDAGRSALDRVLVATGTMGNLIDALLNLSRVAEEDVRADVFDLSAIVRTIAAALTEQAPQRAVAWVVKDGVTVIGDPRLLRVVMQNLLDNAWKFTAKHATACIEFGVTDLGGARGYFVRDDGAGFDMVYADRLFVPLQRFHQAEDFDGAGIGLATVQHIIRRHGGRVWVEAEVERGATVYFTLPRETPGADVRSPKSRVQSPTS